MADGSIHNKYLKQREKWFQNHRISSNNHLLEGNYPRSFFLHHRHSIEVFTIQFSVNNLKKHQHVHPKNRKDDPIMAIFISTSYLSSHITSSIKLPNIYQLTISMWYSVTVYFITKAHYLTAAYPLFKNKSSQTQTPWNSSQWCIVIFEKIPLPVGNLLLVNAHTKRQTHCASIGNHDGIFSNQNI